MEAMEAMAVAAAVAGAVEAAAVEAAAATRSAISSVVGGGSRRGSALHRPHPLHLQASAAGRVAEEGERGRRRGKGG